MTVKELIEILNNLDNKSVDVILVNSDHTEYFGIVEADITIARDGDVLIEIS